MDNTIFRKPGLLKVFIWCLLKATHVEYDAPLGLSTVHLKPGQLIFGRNRAAEELCMKKSTLKNYINFLSGRDRYSDRYEQRELDYFPKGSFSIITVRNWKKYQVLGQQMGQLWDTNNNIIPNRGNKKKKSTRISNQILKDLEKDRQIQNEWKEKQR